MKTKEHYDNHLSKFYSWMIGDFEVRTDEQQSFFKTHNIIPHSNRIAVDLGCGNGIQSIALARLGFEVIAVDFNAMLLSELNDKINDYSITTYEMDIMHFDETVKDNVELITCMGDTISHLTSFQDVNDMIKRIYTRLSQNGKVVLSFRDYSSDIKGDNRFIPVKSDGNRILTCFLEYFDTHVNVTDLLYEQTDGKWEQKVSSYKKCRISEELITRELTKNGFSINSTEIINRMVYVIATKE